MALDASFWHDRRVLLTGHTGFKGGWLATWLVTLGSRVTGLALPPDTSPSFFERCDLARHLTSLMGDVRNPGAVRAAFESIAPEVVFHLAAQPLVLRSYQEPVETFATNVLGAANVLEAARRTPSVRAVVVVTSDKCYADGRPGPRREGDPLGGDDPYSASKSCVEILSRSFRVSFFERADPPVGLATARAGNVIGGGDWAEDRIVPDAIRALSTGKALAVRHPRAVRPWQHVLDPLAGYLGLAERLCRAPREWSGPWNFGPEGDGLSVAGLVDLIVEAWGAGSWTSAEDLTAPPETEALRLDSGLARVRLGWRTHLTTAQAVAWAAEWYRAASDDKGRDMFQLTAAQIARYGELMAGEGV